MNLYLMFRLPKLNLLKIEQHPEDETKQIIRLSKGGFYVLTGFIITILFLGASATHSGESLITNVKNISNGFGKPLQILTLSEEKYLKGEKDDQINTLLMGYGGKGHDGAYLTDTMMLVSYKPSTKEVAMLSFPRDLLVDIPGYNWRKINHIHAFGEIEEAGYGGEFTKEALSKILDVPIHYYVAADFQGFINVIDIVGGIDVKVDNTLDDYKYPILGRENAENIDSRYEHLHIPEGWNTFDGDTALKYVRSRHALGIEGSDFARTRRQQNVLKGFKDKVLSASTLLNPSRITKIKGEIEENVNTNFEIWELIKIAGWAKDFDSTKITTQTLEEGPDGVLYASNYEGAYVLQPKNNDYGIIQKIAQNIFNDQIKKYIVEGIQTYRTPIEVNAKEIVETKEHDEDPRIEIQNGTFVSGLAGDNKTALVDRGYTITKVGNASKQDYDATQIYIPSSSFPETKKELEERYGVKSSTTLPVGISTDADILIILGRDARFLN